MIVCVSSFCRSEWDASLGPCAYPREGEGSYDEEHRRGCRVAFLSLMSSVDVTRVKSRA